MLGWFFRTDPRGFNEAPINRPGKWHTGQCGYPGACPASMRPRSIDRGNACASSSCGPYRRRGFNEAPINRPGKCRTRVRGIPYVPRFNEAPINRPGKYYWADRGFNEEEYCFNEAPINRPGKYRQQLNANALQDASMRPRSIDRGNIGGTMAEPANFKASMRPRSIDRGNTIAEAALRAIFPLQ